MIFRPFRESDIPEIQRIYAANAVKEERDLEALPDLRDETRVFAFVVEDEGQVKAALVFRSMVEVFSVAADARAMMFALSHHEALREKLKSSCVRRVVTWTKRNSVGRFLEKMGWWKIPPDTDVYAQNIEREKE